MKTVIASIVLASTFAFAAPVVSAAGIDSPSQQVWEAQIRNDRKVCGLDFANGQNRIGTIMTQGESTPSDPVRFDVFANSGLTVKWSFDQAKITDNVSEYKSILNLGNGGDLFNVDRNLSSVFVNGQEFAWSQTKSEQILSTKQIAIAPKLNIQKELLPSGTTKIQGRVVITCGQ